MSLSLLANYGSSSESEEEDNEIIKTEGSSLNSIISDKTKIEKTSKIESKLSSIIPPPKNSLNSLLENSKTTNKKHSLFSKLPEPKRVKETNSNKKYISLIAPIEDEEDEETKELKREIEEEKKRKLNKNYALKDDLEKSNNDNETQKQGLFSLLPAPHNSNKKNNEKEKKNNSMFGMIPLSLKKKQEQKKVKEKKNEKGKSEELNKDKLNKEEEEEVTDDFFSLDNTPSLSKDNNDKNDEISSESNNINNNNLKENESKINLKPEIENDNVNYTYNQYNQEYDINQYQYPQKPAEGYNIDYNNYYNQYYNYDINSSDPNFNKNILKLQEMGEFQIGEIKEINQKDQISNVYEVERTKQISLSNQPSINFKGIGKDFKPSFKQKSKHNIMYLAYQAKAKEQELMEANLQRKANRKISGKKYGF